MSVFLLFYMHNVVYNTFLCLLFARLSLSMLTKLLLSTKSFLRTLLNHFISKVVHDLFSCRHEVLANGPRLR